MKNFKTAVICTLLSGVVYGQQDIQFTQALSNPYLFNVGAAGMSNVGEFNVGMRTQWLSVDGRPVTYYASGQSQIRFGKAADKVLGEFNTEGKSIYNSPVRTVGRKHIFGGKAMSDAIGPFAKTSALLSYAIHLPLTKKVNIGLGVGMGFSSFSIDNSKVKLSETNDGAYLSYLGSASRQNWLDMQSGFVLYNDHLYIGISGTQLLRNRTQFRGIATESNFERHWYFMGSYRFDLGEKYGLEPVLMVKNTVGSPLSLDAGARFHYYRMGWISLGYRGKSAFSAGFGINVLKQFRLAYAYEMGISNLSSYGNGSHEIHLGWVFGSRRNMEKEFREQQKEQEKAADDELQIGTE
jgi:type IX secretion system PorP/SprF family membrane protein